MKRGAVGGQAACGAGSGLKGWVGRGQADLGQGAPVHVGTADVEVGLVHHPELGVQDTMGQLLHVHHADLGTCDRRVVVRPGLSMPKPSPSPAAPGSPLCSRVCRSAWGWGPLGLLTAIRTFTPLGARVCSCRRTSSPWGKGTAFEGWDQPALQPHAAAPWGLF